MQEKTFALASLKESMPGDALSLEKVYQLRPAFVVC